MTLAPGPISPRPRQRAALAVAVAFLVTAACVRRPQEPPIAVQVWPDASGDARRAVAAGAYPTADTTLARFARSYDGSEQASESLFLLALFRLDPKNTGATRRDAIRALDAYLALPAFTPHAEEARALRRLAMHLDSLSQPAPAAAAAAVSAEELQKLRDDLKRTTDELDRIKRRLAQPRP